MSKYAITLIVGFLLGMLLMMMSNIQGGDSLKDAYERGYKQGYLAGTYQVTEIIDDRLPTNVMEAREYDMRECLGDDVVDEFLAGIVDSTDTMPVEARATDWPAVLRFDTAWLKYLEE